VTQHGVVLVDTKLPNNGEAILNQVHGVTDKPVTMIINTHSHPDHIGSNEYPASVDVVAHENTRKSMEYGGTPYSRAVINVSVAFQELGKR